MKTLVYEVRLREADLLPLNIAQTEGRQRILELLDQFLDVENVLFKGVKPKER